MKRILFFAILFLLSCNLQAQDSAYARKIIRTLSSAKMQGRGTSYKGDSIAAQYLAGEMQRLGVLPLQVNYMQHFTYSCYSHEGPISLRVNGTELMPYTQFRIYPSSRYATPNNLEKALHKKQLKDGTWLIGVEKLDTYGPIVNTDPANPICIEVLDSLLPKRIKKVVADIPVNYHHGYKTQNVVGYVRGVVDTMIVFTAHYDHCGTMGDGIIFPGAHDNASGVAAVMDLARMATQQRPYYTMVFMLLSGEESGLLGSHYAVENPLIDFKKVKLLCNIDLFCGGDDGIMVFNAKSDNTKPFFDKIKNLNDEFHVAREVRPRDNSANSDHYWFSLVCPSIYILTMGKPYGGYHDPYDTCQECGLGHYVDYMSIIKQLAYLE